LQAKRALDRCKPKVHVEATSAPGGESQGSYEGGGGSGDTDMPSITGEGQSGEERSTRNSSSGPDASFAWSLEEGTRKAQEGRRTAS